MSSGPCASMVLSSLDAEMWLLSILLLLDFSVVQ